MSHVRGQLALVKGKIEHWRKGGEISYTVMEPEHRGPWTPGHQTLDWEHRYWSIRLRRNGRSLHVGYRTGMGITATPTGAEALGAMFADARCALDAADLNDFADTFGYDLSDPREASETRKTFNACVRADERLDAFFGGDADSRRAWEDALIEAGL